MKKKNFFYLANEFKVSQGVDHVTFVNHMTAIT